MEAGRSADVCGGRGHKGHRLQDHVIMLQDPAIMLSESLNAHMLMLGAISERGLFYNAVARTATRGQGVQDLPPV